MGYYDYQHGLIYRHLNQDKGWNSHLANCRNYILRAAEILNPQKITVLGSGWLLEFPVYELAQKTKEIYLIDIVHPPAVKKQIAELENVELIEKDLTGGLIDEVWNSNRNKSFFNKPGSMKSIEIPEYRFDEDPGMLISMNILTQLEVLPEKILKRKTNASEEELLEFRKKVQAKHIASIKKYKPVLITDTSEIITDIRGNVTENKTLLVELPESSGIETWVWDFDLKRSDYNRKQSVLNVTARIL